MFKSFVFFFFSIHRSFYPCCTRGTHRNSYSNIILPNFLAKMIAISVYLYMYMFSLSIHYTRIRQSTTRTTTTKNKTPKIHRKIPTNQMEEETESKRVKKREKEQKKELPAILIQEHKYELKFLGTQTNYVSVYILRALRSTNVKKTNSYTFDLFYIFFFLCCVWLNFSSV